MTDAPSETRAHGTAVRAAHVRIGEADAASRAHVVSASATAFVYRPWVSTLRSRSLRVVRQADACPIRSPEKRDRFLP